MPTLVVALPEIGDQFLSTHTFQSFCVIGAVSYYFLVIRWHESEDVQLVYWDEYEQWLFSRDIIKL